MGKPFSQTVTSHSHFATALAPTLQRPPGAGTDEPLERFAGVPTLERHCR